MKNRSKLILSSIAITGFSSALNAQIPTDVPHPNDNTPIDLTNPADIIIYILLPLAMILLFIIWRSKKRKDKKK